MQSEQITISVKEIKQEKDKEKENTEDQVFEELKEEEEDDQHEEMLTIKMSDDYYIIVGKSKLNEVYETEQEWQEFLLKIYTHYPYNLKELNSIISIRKQQISIREQYWQVIIDRCKSKEKALLSNSYSGYCEEERQMQKNIARMYEKFQKPMPAQQHKMIKEILCRYANAQQQIGYTKGLQYVCYGIIKSHPSSEEENILRAFIYIMEQIRVKELFYQGSPLFYEELQGLEEELKIETPLLWKVLKQNDADSAKIFIRYYKTILLSSVYDEQIARKVFEMFIVYGIKVVKLLLIKILTKNEKLIIQKYQEPDLLFEYVANYTVVDFFSNNSLLEGKEVTSQIQNQNSKQQVKQEEKESEEMRSSYRSCQSDKNEGMVSSEKKNSFLPKMDQKGSEERAQKKVAIQFKIDKQKEMTGWFKQLLFSL